MRKRWQKYCIVSLKVHDVLCMCVCVFIPLSQGQLLGVSQISLMSLEVIQNLCAFTYSWVKPGAQTERRGRQKESVVYGFAEAGTLAATGHADPLVHF